MPGTRPGMTGFNGWRRHLTRTRAAARIAGRPSPIRVHRQKKRGGRSLCRPRGLDGMTYFRLVIAVRSAESLAMPAAPHQLEPAPVGLIEVMLLVPAELKALVKALQLPFDRSVSE
jgi:hypothetical protein